MKPRTQLIVIFGTVIIAVLFVLLMKQYNPTSTYDGFKTVRELYFRPTAPTDRIVLQEKTDNGETIQRFVRIKPEFISTIIEEVNPDTLNRAVWKEIE